MRYLVAAPWRRAPLLLLRRPGVLATVAGATFVLVAAITAVPMFLSSVRTEAVALQVDERCPVDTGVGMERLAAAGDVTAPAADPFAPLRPALGPSTRWFRMESIWLEDPRSERRTQTFVLAEERALQRVEVIDRVDLDGIWISDRARESTGLDAGDTARLGETELVVAGVYRDLSGSTVGDDWCAHADMLLLRGQDLESPPPLVIAPPAAFAAVMDGAGIDAVRSAWEAPLGAGLTVARARSLVDELACADDAVAPELVWCADGMPGIPVAARGRPGTDEVRARDAAGFVAGYFGSALPFVVARATATGTAVAGGIWPVAALASLAGAGLVAAAASLWFERRRTELWLLTVRGASPLSLGVKAVLELGMGVLAGAAAGHLLARTAVARLGPSPRIEGAAVGDALRLTGAGVVVAAGLVAVVVAMRMRAVQRARRAAWLRLVPWELGLAAAAVVSYDRLGRWGTPVGSGADVTDVDVWGLLFPVLFLLAVVGITVRLLGASTGLLRRRSVDWPIALHLAARRVTRYRSAVAALAAASAVAAGVLGYAATLNRSLDAGLDTKARTFVGSDVAVRIPAGAALPEELRSRATIVTVHRWAWLEHSDRPREEVAVYGVDRDTFARAEAGGDVDGLGPADDGRIPAIVVGVDVVEGDAVRIDRGSRPSFEIAPVASVDSFPGARRATPTIFVAHDALPPDVGATSTEAWIAGDRDATLAALADAGIPFSEPRAVDEVIDGPAFLTVTWTFGFMQTLGIAAGLLVLGGAGTYLDARRRRRVLAHAFTRRMGLTRGQHRTALAAELSAGIVVGCWLGLAAALVGAALAIPRLDPVPTFDPAPLLSPATTLVAGLATLAVALTIVAAVVAQRATDRDDVVEVLRAGA